MPMPANGSPWGSKQKHVKKVKSLIVIVLWGPYIGYIHQLLYMRLNMYLSIECPTPLYPGQGASNVSHCTIKSDLHVRHFTEDVSH